MTDRRVVEILFAVLLGWTVYHLVERRAGPVTAPAEDESTGWEEVFTAGSTADVWKAIDRLEEKPERVSIQTASERLCRLRNDPAFELIRARLRRSALADLDCDGR